MKKISKLLFCLASFNLALSSCGRPIEAKPGESDKQYEIFKLAQEAGFTGTYEEWLASIKGDRGPAGEDGKDGASFLSGAGAPASSLGKDGDSYLDLYSNDFYKKENGIWVKVGNITTSGSSGSSDGLGDGNEFFGVSCLLYDDKLESYQNYRNEIYYAIPNQFSPEFVTWSASSDNVKIEKNSNWSSSVCIYSGVVGTYDITISFDFKNIHKSLTFPFIVKEGEVKKEMFVDTEYIDKQAYKVYDVLEFNDINVYENYVFPDGTSKKGSYLNNITYTLKGTDETFSMYGSYRFMSKGTYTFIVSIKDNELPSTEFSITVNEYPDIESSQIYYDTDNVKTEYTVGEEFKDELSIFYECNRGNILLEKDVDYTVSIEDGYVFEESGTYQVVYSFINFDIDPISYSIHVSKPASPDSFIEVMSQIGNNYTTFIIEENDIKPIYAVNENYYYNYSLGEGYYLDEGEVRRYSVVYENSTSDNVILQKRAKVSDGFNSDKTPHYATTLEYPMAGLGYTHASNLEYSSSDVLQYQEVKGDNMFAVSTDLATQLLGVFGFGVLALNYDISSAIVTDTTLELANGTTLPLILSQVIFSSNGQNIGGLAFGLSFFGTSGESIIDAFIEDENKPVNEAVDAELTTAQDIVASNCFTARYGEFSDGSYSTYSVDSKSIEWYDHSVTNGDSTKGLISIPEGKNVSAGYYQYGLNDDGEVEIDDTITSSKQDFDFYTPSNWYGFSKEDSSLGLNFDNMWLFSGFYQGDAVQKEAAYTKYTLYNQDIAEAWSSQAFLYSDSYFNDLSSQHGYSFVGISFYLIDIDFDDSYDSFEICLECTAETIVGYATWEILSIDTDSVGTFSNTKVDTYLSSITPIE